MLDKEKKKYELIPKKKKKTQSFQMNKKSKKYKKIINKKIL